MPYLEDDESDDIKCPVCKAEAVEIGKCICCMGIEYMVVHAGHPSAGTDIWTACSPSCPRSYRKDALRGDDEGADEGHDHEEEDDKFQP